MKNYKNIAEIKKANYKINHYWFAPKTMEFFKSRVESGVINGNMFISSEMFGERRYTIRLALPTGEIKNLWPVGRFDSLDAAIQHARQIDQTTLQAYWVGYNLYKRKNIKGFYHLILRADTEIGRSLRGLYDHYEKLGIGWICYFRRGHSYVVRTHKGVAIFATDDRYQAVEKAIETGPGTFVMDETSYIPQDRVIIFTCKGVY